MEMNTSTENLDFCRTYKVQFKPQTPYAPLSNGLVGNRNCLLDIFRCTVLDSQYDTWKQKVKTFTFTFNSQIRANMNLSPYERVFGQKPKKPTMLKLSSTTDGLNCKPLPNSPCNSFPKHTHTLIISVITNKLKKIREELLLIGF